MILVDHREKGSGVVEKLEELGVRLDFSTLDVGDYIIEDICIERKSCSDFIASIIDKRLFEQVRYMAQAYSKIIIIIEGILSDALRHRRIGYPQVYGAVAALLENEATVLRTEDQKETAYAIYYLYKRRVDQRKKSYLQPVKVKIQKSNKSIENVQLNMLASIPGISREMAHKILLYFKTPRRFFKAPPEELRKVEGLGTSRITRIVEALDTIYFPAMLMNSDDGNGD